MFLYRGSNIQVDKPRILESLRALDFGAGFYTTSSREQVEKWAEIVTKRRQTGVPTISSYSFDEKAATELKILKFDFPDGDWLDFVVANRKEQPVSANYDLIIGPVANDQAIRTVNNFQNGYFNEDIAVQILRPQKLKDQYAFKTDAALHYLHFKEVIS